MKATAIAPSNIAFIKYWGKRDENLRLPANGSISMNLSNLTTTTTVEFSSSFKKDRVIIDGINQQGITKERVVAHLDRIRKKAGISERATIVSKNNFPVSTGLSSSASGFAALTVAASKAAGLTLSEKQLSILARQASGSACRSIPEGFVEWIVGNSNESSYSYSIFPPEYWDIYDIVVICENREKEVPTSTSQKDAYTSPFFSTRLSHIENKIIQLKKYLEKKDFHKFGTLIEDEALELHTIILTSQPSRLYWQPQTVSLMHFARKLRKEGLPVYFTVNTGHNIHLISQKKHIKALQSEIKKHYPNNKIIVNQPSKGAYCIKKHLF